ncbi:glycosyl hydrolase catalytic core-domain-containing protein [Apiospora marii]|uniref:glycosyl hydrolase catalytic core-domain-containing protein n=1 Tax=Apiospora marii TaxID=335849 RepID=UPI0031317BEC
MVSLRSSKTPLLLALSLLTTLTAATTRGLALGAEPLSDADLGKLVQPGTPIKWYYTWSLSPNNYLKSNKGDIKFFPLVNPDQANAGLANTLNGLRAGSDHLLTFNEPDIPPTRAAQLYLDFIKPLREKGWKVSHPVVSGSPQGRAWLQQFRDACQARDSAGCTSDFVSVHWYGPLDGLKDHLEQLRKFYNPVANGMKFYITELAQPSASESDNLALLKGAAPYLDGLNWVEGYAWFGSFRQRDANGWTGPGVALLNNNGDLTSVGKYYVNK